MSDKIEAFNAVAGIYDNWYEHPQGKQVFEAERNAVQHMIPPAGLGLEIGCGTGIFAESLIRFGRPILCLDPSTEMLSNARKRGLMCILGVGDLLPIRGGVLDFSYMVTVLEFLDAPLDLFKEVRGVSKETASLSVLFINSDSSWGELYRKIGAQGDPVFRHANLYTLDEVTGLIDEADYVVSDVNGTLNSDPMSQEVDQTLVEPSGKSGVLIVKAMKRV